MVSIEYVSFVQNRQPYLHRTEQPGAPQLNEMATDLNMNGNSITNVSELTASSVTVLETLETTNLVADTVTAGELFSLVASTTTITGDYTVSGNLDVGGQITASSAAITGGIVADLLYNRYDFEYTRIGGSDDHNQRSATCRYGVGKNRDH